MQLSCRAIGENIQIRRVLTVIPKDADKSIGVYSHLGGKIVTVVEITGSADEEALAKDIAMHVAAAAPDYFSPEKVPETLIKNEKEIAAVKLKASRIISSRRLWKAKSMPSMMPFV